MVKHMARIIIVSLMLWSVAEVMGQAPSGPPQPEPEHKKLAYFGGKWTSEGGTFQVRNGTQWGSPEAVVAASSWPKEGTPISSPKITVTRIGKSC